MKNFATFVESTSTNKFNIHWQLVRTNAREIKDVEEKIDYVLHFLDHHPNKHNFKRVLNWTKMTGVAYPKESEERKAFIRTEHQLRKNIDQYDSEKDDSNDMSQISTDNLRKVLKDLKTRKYNFQFGKTPVAHTEFVAKLEDELKNR